jgi:hypothetical protein
LAPGATAIIGTITVIIRLTSPLRNATAIARAMMENKTISDHRGTMPGIYFGNMEKQNSIDWLIEKFYNNEGMITTKQLEQAKEMYHDEIEALIIKQCAEQSTSEAHKKEIHRQQIIQTYIDAKMERNIVKKHFAYFLKLERVTDKAEQYYNETYNL